MVRIEILSAQHAGIAAFVEASADGCRIGGPRADLIDPREPMLGLPSGRRVIAEEAPEEWARGLIVRYRSPDLTAQIVHDDQPLAAEAGRVGLHEPALR
jgi:hypothetical protein